MHLSVKIQSCWKNWCLYMMLKAPRRIDFDNKRAYFSSKIRQQHEQHLAGPSRFQNKCSRVYVFEDLYEVQSGSEGRLYSFNFQGEEEIDAGGHTRE